MLFRGVISYSRWILLFIVGFCIILLLISHFFFQQYLFMQPCEQCVYIRFYFCIIIFGALSMMINFAFVKILGFGLLVYGVRAGIYHSVILNKIYNALHNSGNIFGLSGCSLTPNFPFNLALDRWIPSLFKISGDCGIDSPKIPKGVELDSIQQYFTSLYSNGWYLLPQLRLLNMAECCIIAFGVICVALILLGIFSLVKNKVLNKS